MTAFSTLIRTYYALGPINVARVAAYRARVRIGAFDIAPTRKPEDVEDFSDFFLAPYTKAEGASPTGWLNEGKLFGWFKFPIGQQPPNWLADPMSGRVHPGAGVAWFKLSDFDAQFGDIKPLWELSRFGWALPMARRFASGDALEGARLNTWIKDWNSVNPAWRGPNWKCGQEASIRVLHLAMAALILGSSKSMTAPLSAMVREHLSRVASSLAYARAQDNNHGTSEAAALYIGGSWLAQTGFQPGLKWQAAGRAALEERVAALVSEDGSFSQHSVVYHRMLLDTLVMVERWRQVHHDANFSAAFRGKAVAAARWLDLMIFSSEGDCPNLGANDGAHLFNVDDTPYRDFRSSVSQAEEVFSIAPRAITEAANRQFDDGGYVTLDRGRAKLLLRYARFKFRPSQCDVNHVDFWLDGEAIFRDGGTYSYNDPTRRAVALSDAEGHNTLQFGSRPQMPRLGRFLLGDWLDAGPVACRFDTTEGPQVSAGYVDRGGFSHLRAVRLDDHALSIEDKFSSTEAGPVVVRWRLKPGEWLIDGNEVTGQHVKLRINCDEQCVLSLSEGLESKYYLLLSQAPVLSITSFGAGRIVTHVTW